MLRAKILDEATGVAAVRDARKAASPGREAERSTPNMLARQKERRQGRNTEQSAPFRVKRSRSTAFRTMCMRPWET